LACAACGTKESPSGAALCRILQAHTGAWDPVSLLQPARHRGRKSMMRPQYRGSADCNHISAGLRRVQYLHQSLPPASRPAFP
jgi:hypothetical protein